MSVWYRFVFLILFPLLWSCSENSEPDLESFKKNTPDSTNAISETTYTASTPVNKPKDLSLEERYPDYIVDSSYLRFPEKEWINNSYDWRDTIRTSVTHFIRQLEDTSKTFFAKYPDVDHDNKVIHRRRYYDQTFFITTLQEQDTIFTGKIKASQIADFDFRDLEGKLYNHGRLISKNGHRIFEGFHDYGAFVIFGPDGTVLHTGQSGNNEIKQGRCWLRDGFYDCEAEKFFSYAAYPSNFTHVTYKTDIQFLKNGQVDLWAHGQDDSTECSIFMSIDSANQVSYTKSVRCWSCRTELSRNESGRHFLVANESELFIIDSKAKKTTSFKLNRVIEAEELVKPSSYLDEVVIDVYPSIYVHIFTDSLISDYKIICTQMRDVENFNDGY